MRIFSGFFFLPLLILLTACYTREVDVQLQDDGTGTLTVTTTASHALLTYARNQGGMPPEEWWFSPNTLEKAAEGYGPGVRYLDHEITDLEDGKRFTVRYTFENINTLEVRVSTEAPFFLTPPDRQQDDRPVYTFHYQPPNLRITPPPRSPVRSRNPYVRIDAPRAQQQRQERFQSDLRLLRRHGNPFKLAADETPESLVNTLADGMRFDITLTLPAPLLTSNARHIDNTNPQHPRLTLFQLDAETFLEHEPAMTRATDGEIHLLQWSDLVRMPGVKAEHGPPVLLILTPPGDPPRTPPAE